jgi:two-component system, OmpR family, phosphate regulon response regulator PhoB
MKNANANSSIIVALSDVATMTIISYHLERIGFIVSKAQNTDILLNIIDRLEPNMIIIDEDLPGAQSAKNICTYLKNTPQTSNIKIIYVASQKNDDLGFATDHIIKPFVPSQLVQKVNSQLSMQEKNLGKKIISYQDIEMNLTTFRISRNGRNIHLGPNEFKIFQCFLEHPGKILSREHIMNYVWGHNSQVEPRTIDVHINRLRSALKNSEDEIPLIKTVRSSGYSLCAPKEFARV